MKFSSTLLLATATFLSLFGAQAAPAKKTTPATGGGKLTQIAVTANSGKPMGFKPPTENIASCPASSKPRAPQPLPAMKISNSAKSPKSPRQKFKSKRNTPTVRQINETLAVRGLPLWHEPSEPAPPDWILKGASGKTIYVAPGETKVALSDETLWTDSCQLGHCMAFTGFAMDNSPNSPNKKYGSILSHVTTILSESDPDGDLQKQIKSLDEAVINVMKPRGFNSLNDFKFAWYGPSARKDNPDLTTTAENNLKVAWERIVLRVFEKRFSWSSPSCAYEMLPKQNPSVEYWKMPCHSKNGWMAIFPGDINSRGKVQWNKF